jgi:hypothetical protein
VITTRKKSKTKDVYTFIVEVGGKGRHSSCFAL